MNTPEPLSADRPTLRRADDADDLPPTYVHDTPPPVASSVAIPAVLLAGADRADPFDRAATNHLADAAASLLRAGGEFLGFRLEEEIGRGGYGRVYLARQADLAGRPVALKVTLDAVAETRTLAQLQHANIVPVYSFHRAGPFQAVCMPYLGRTTLADVVRHVRNRSALPLSGKELHSTVAGRGGTTRSPSGPRPAAPAEVGRPEPTLGWERVSDLTYPDAVLTLAAELADGLAHAHARGILHRDLKPANVLLSDDGRAMLLDFGMAEDTKLRGTTGETTIGGTVPYMAPEHLDAYRLGRAGLDTRCDVYSLGVIVFELLTGRAPFPTRVGGSDGVLQESAADRRRPVPWLRGFNPALSPAVEALVRKCLAANPADRYQSAADLGDDIRRHLAHRPLRHAPNPSVGERVRKFACRWPRLTSSGSVAAAALLLLAGGAVAANVARERSLAMEARGRLAEHDTAFRDAQLFLDDRQRSWPALDEGLGKVHAILARYDAADGDTWLSSPAVQSLPEADRERVRQDVGEAYYLMAQVAHLKASAATTPAERASELERGRAWNERAAQYAGDRLPRAVREQRAALLALGGSALPVEAPPEPGSARDRFLVGAQLARVGRQRDALPHLTEATRLDPSNVSAWFVRGTAHLGLEQNELAAVSFAACVALRPDFAPAWQNRGVALNRLRQFPAARADFDRTLELDPARGEVYVLRAGLRDAAGDLPGAHDDLSAALAAGVSPVRVHFLRAAVRDRLKDKAGAAADRDAGLKLTPTDELSWVARGGVRKVRDAAGALADADEALKLNPTSAPALQLKAHLLAEYLNRPADALVAMNRAVSFHPDYVPARAGRAVLLARAGKRDDALRDAKEALLRDTRGPNLYQVACVYALTAATHPEDKPEALRLLATALRAGFGQQYIESDADLAALRGDPEFQRLLATTKGPRPAPRP